MAAKANSKPGHTSEIFPQVVASSRGALRFLAKMECFAKMVKN